MGVDGDAEVAAPDTDAPRMTPGNFTPMLHARAAQHWARMWLGANWVKPSGQLHEPSPAAVRKQARHMRRLRRRIRRNSWWWRVRAPLRRWGGCPEEE